MSVTAATLRRLAELHLAPEQMVGVLGILAEMAEIAEQMQALEDERKKRDRSRKERLPADWFETRLRIISRDNGICGYCGCTPESPHVDHIHPLSRSGSSDDDNLITACPDCNISKGARTPDEWRSV